MKKISSLIILIRKAIGNEGKNYSVILILIRLIYWKLKYNAGISDFFRLNLHKRGLRFNMIIGLKEFKRIHDKLNPAYYRSLLEDKYVFDRFMKSFNFPLAEMRGILMNDNIFWISENKIEPVDNIMNYELSCYCKMHTKWGGQDLI